jgi:O-antigen/teichoic acid export membrane protein
VGSEVDTGAGAGFSPVALFAAILVVAAFYAPFAYLRYLAERAADGRTPTWGRRVLPALIVGFLLVAVATAFVAPSAFGGVILGGCIGITIAFQVRRPRRPPPPTRPTSGPPRPDPPGG